MKLISYGAAEEVTGSCHYIEVSGQRILLDCGLIQGHFKNEQRNKMAFPFDASKIDAVILSHAHLDHSGRIPLLIKAGFKGPIYTHTASRDLCQLLFKDAGFINEKDAKWENKYRARKGASFIKPLYTVREAQKALLQIKPVSYDRTYELSSNIKFRFKDAGHILGSASIELWLVEAGISRKLVFSGDLGHRDAPILRDPSLIGEADYVIMESTYGNRLHRSWDETHKELNKILLRADEAKGNILIPAFAVGRTQELLYLFSRFFKEWKLDRWQVFIDSPMAIEATAIYANHSNLYDSEAIDLWVNQPNQELASRLHFCRTTLQSAKLNQIKSGAIIIAGSGMCNGGRIRHHLKHNVWRHGTHVLIIGYQGKNTIGRQLVDGDKEVRLWDEEIKVNAQIHTVGGLSAHADQTGLVGWYKQFINKPTLLIVHGEPDAQLSLATKIKEETGAVAKILKAAEVIEIL